METCFSSEGKGSHVPRAECRHLPLPTFSAVLERGQGAATSSENPALRGFGTWEQAGHGPRALSPLCA